MNLLSIFRRDQSQAADGSRDDPFERYGLDPKTVDPRFQAGELFRNERTNVLNFRDSYYTARNHDGKAWNWDGNIIAPAHHPTQPLIGSSEPNVYIPMNQRRPSAPTRIARIIVNAFTGMLFGDKRFPTITSSDPLTKDFAEELVRASKLETHMIRARKIGGSNGTVVLSWWFDSGRPRVRVHAPKFIHVLEWADPDDFEIAHAVELYQFKRVERNPNTKKVETVMYWQRRDWTTVADVFFYPKRVEEKEPTAWVVDESKSLVHDSGFAHLIWVQNLPDEDTFSVDGQTDYGELYEPMDEYDLTNSAYLTGVKKNVDPTAVLGIDRADYNDAVLRKGSEHALIVGLGGTAQYMTLPSDMVTAGSTATRDLRAQILEAAECVIPDPDKVAAAGTSSVALKMIYSPMLVKVDVLRQQYGDAIVRLLNQMLIAARDLMPNAGASDDAQRFVHEYVVDDEGNPVIDPDTGAPKLEPVDYRLDLRPKVTKVPRFDDSGNPTGEYDEKSEPRNPGAGEIELVWPDYFRPTDTDRQAKAGAISLAVSGKVLSMKTGSREMATDYETDPEEEYAQIRKEQAEAAAAAQAAQTGMFPNFGGQVTEPVEYETEAAPEAVEPAPEAEAPAEPAEAPEPGVMELGGGISIELAPTTISKLITANEARRLMGQGPATLPDGSPDPAGNLPIDIYAQVLAERNAPKAPPTSVE